MKYFSVFQQSKPVLSFEEKERRRQNEYWRPGSNAEQDQKDYIEWLENQLEARLSDADKLTMKVT